MIGHLTPCLRMQAAELAAVHVGQADVEEHEVVVLLLRPGQPLLAVAGLEDVELLGGDELVGQRLAQVRVVVHHQDLAQGTHCRLSRFDFELFVPYVPRNDRRRGLTELCPREGVCYSAAAGGMVPGRRGGDCAWPSGSHRSSSSPGPGPTCGWGPRSRLTGRRGCGPRHRRRGGDGRAARRPARPRAARPRDHRLAGGDAEGPRLRRRHRPRRGAARRRHRLGPRRPPIPPPTSPGR